MPASGPMAKRAVESRTPPTTSGDQKSSVPVIANTARPPPSVASVPPNEKCAAGPKQSSHPRSRWRQPPTVKRQDGRFSNRSIGESESMLTSSRRSSEGRPDAPSILSSVGRNWIDMVSGKPKVGSSRSWSARR